MIVHSVSPGMENKAYFPARSIPPPILQTRLTSMVDASFVQDFHQQKMKIIVWTVNQEADIKKMAALGVDGIISDYPNRFAVLKQ
jgi:glycerophosphoryl diester phosphodiesterase